MYTLAEIEAMALAMSPDDRGKLADALLASLAEAPPPEVDAAWALEVADRLDAYSRGEVAALDAASVFAEARQTAP
jgi:putative addiction module component (TIGR02574 family)